MQNLSDFKGVIDTTLRDGQQSPLLFDTYTYRLTLEDKMLLLDGLIKLGVKNFEFFSPVVSKTERADFIVIQNKFKIKNPNLRFIAHCRCHPKDIETAIEAGFDGLNLYMGAAPHAREHSHGLPMTEMVSRVTETIKNVRSQNPNIYLRFSAEDCFRTELPEIYRIYDKIASYVDTFGMPDTVGIATPDMVTERVKALRSRYPKVDLECHFHNDRGLSLINAVSAVLAGVSYVDTTVWGMAERSGITSVTGLLFNLFQENPDYCKGFNLEVCYPLNVLLGSILKYHVPYKEPVSVTNRTHTAGVHQKAVLNNKRVYEAMDLGKFGVTQNQLLLGPLSGWNLVYYYLREFKFYDVTKEQAKLITADFKTQTYKISRKRNPESVIDDVILKYNLKKLSIRETDMERRYENFI